MEVAEGEQVSMTCIVRANPKVHSVTWSKNVSYLIYEKRKILHKMWYIRISKGERLLGSSRLETTTTVSSGTSVLHLADLERGDSGEYSCVAENLVGRGRSNKLRVDVKCECLSKQVVDRYTFD